MKTNQEEIIYQNLESELNNGYETNDQGAFQWAFHSSHWVLQPEIDSSNRKIRNWSTPVLLNQL